MDEMELKSFRITGSIELGAAAPQPAGPFPPAAPGFSISGNLVSERYGYPLPGLTISAYFIAAEDPAAAADFSAKQGSISAGAPPGAETLLGEGVSDRQGGFQIALRESLDVRQKLCLLEQFPDLPLRLKVFGADGQLYYTSGPLHAAAGSVVAALEIPLPPAEVTAEMWAALGERLEQARLSQVRLLAQELAAPAGGALFADWSLETRQEALNQLEQDFLDPQGLLRAYAWPMPTLSEARLPGALQAFQEQLSPHLENPELQAAFADYVGKVGSFADLFSVDWVMDLNDLRQGAVGLAINKYIDQYRPGFDRFPGLSPRFVSDLERYRDYLREIWPTWIVRVIYIDPQGWTRQKALDQLRNRFHQDFFTTETASRPANQVLIPILTEILTAAPGGTWGFGVPAANIDPQGTRSPREYLDYLISLTGLSPQELGLRYRLDFTRPDSALSSPVQENIAALQGFYRDSFQCDLEPAHTDPDVLKQPIVPDKLLGKAPFFLHYDEWLHQQATFYPENFFDVRRAYPVEVEPSAAQELRNWLKAAIQNASDAAERADWLFIQKVWDISDKMAQGHAQYYRGEYADALARYSEAASMAGIAVQDKLVGAFDIRAALAKRKKMSVKDMSELETFMKPLPFGLSLSYNLRAHTRDDMILALIYDCLYTLPVCLGDACLALGDYAQAVFYYGQTTRFGVGVAKETSSAGYRPEYSYYNPAFPLYYRGDRPYTVNLHQGSYDEYPAAYDPDEYYGVSRRTAFEQLAADLIAKYVHPVEMKYFRLRQANAMLEWADALYRTDEAASIQRARELYKGVSFLHGETPPICPQWPVDWRRGMGLGISVFLNHQENPALASQKARARKGFFQIEAGLNYYGEREDIVPPLRYRPLKETADRYAALAMAAQQDFLLYMEKMESALVERMKLSNLLQKVSLQSNIAQEQIKVAEYNVAVAQQQLSNLIDQITAKQKELADSQSFFSQFGDFIGGMVKTFTSLPGDTQSAVSAGFVSEVTGKELVGEGMLGLGAGASIMTGFAIFAVAGYMSMNSMAEAYNSRAGELRALREKALPMAQGLVAARQREVKIASYQQQIAQADMNLARDLIQFEENRFLNLNFWANLAQIVRRILRRYLELGARMAWLAERALAYEQDRRIRIVRMDYFPEKTQGVTGANLLQADLAELEATRIEGIKRSVPVKFTFSLARDFPLQFGQLKQSGRCAFKTAELPFALAYPGTSGYRIRAVSLMVSQTSLTNPLRGLLINQGVSISHPGQPDEHVIVRPAEALPISEFKLHNDMAIYSLPDETLLTFEGSAVETFWEIHFPAAANAFGFDGIADVLLTFDLWAQYSPELYAKQIANPPTSVRRWIVVSGNQYHPQAIKDLAGAANPVAIPFDLGALRLPAREVNRKLKNVAIFFVSPTPLDVTADFSAAQPAATVNTTFKGGMAMSNLPPTASAPVPPPLPLNALADFTIDQRFSLRIDKNQNPGADFSRVSNVVLAVEYEADLV